MYKGLVWFVVIVAALIGAARATAIRWWKVPGDDATFATAIEPTIHAGDLVLLWRLTRPQIGDLVLCPHPQDSSQIVLGRILASEGDSLDIEGPLLTVNGRRIANERACDSPQFEVADPSTGAPAKLRCDMEVVGSAVHPRGVPGPGMESYGITQGHFDVSPGHFFLVSDDRVFPYDSREFGEVPMESCQEAVFFRLISSGGWFDADQRLSFVR